MTLEDETGIANLIVWPKAFERLRAIVIGARFVAATGKLQNESGVIHLIVERMEDLTPMLGLLSREDPEADPFRIRRSAVARRAAPPGRPLRPDAALLRPAPAADARAARSRPRPAERAELSLRRRHCQASKPAYATSSGVGARLSPTIIARTRFSRWRRLASATPARWATTSNAKPCAIQECRCCAPDEPQNASVVSA